MKKWIMFCLTLLISIILAACSSNGNESNEDINNNGDSNANTEEQVDTNTENNEELDMNSEENEDLDTNSQEDHSDSAKYDFDPNGENIVALQSVQNGVTMKLTYKADGDNVIEQTANNELPYESIGVSTAEEAEEALADIVAAYQGVEGITHSMDYQEDRAFETLTMNYEIIDMKAASELTGVIMDGDASQGISLKKSVDMLVEQGFEIVE